MARASFSALSLRTLTLLHHAPMALFTVGILAVSVWVLYFIPRRSSQIITEAQLDADAAALIAEQGTQLWWVWVLSLACFLGFAVLSTLVSAWSHRQVRYRLERMVQHCERYLAGALCAERPPPPEGRGALARMEQQLDGLFTALDEKQAGLQRQLRQHATLTQLADGLEMASSCDERLSLLEVALLAVVPEGAVTVLLVSEHGALLPRAAGGGCSGVSTASGCAALRRRNQQPFSRPGTLSACPQLCASATCQPLLGHSSLIGAIHIQTEAPLHDDQAETVGIIAHYVQHYLDTEDDQVLGLVSLR